MPRRSVSKGAQSPLQEEQTRRTRERILDGLVAAMKDGLVELSVPAVARAAQVSVPTIYRYFPNKRALFQAVAEHVGAKSRLLDVEPPRDLAGLGQWVTEVFRRVEAQDPAIAAAMASALGSEMRRETFLPQRRKLFERALAPALVSLPAEERGYLLDAVVVLTSSAAVRAFKSYLGADAEQAAATVNWVLGRLTEGTTWKPSSKRR